MRPTALVMAVVMASTLSVASASVPPDAEASSCQRHVSSSTPPTYIYVFRSHERGTSRPRRVERWSLAAYVGAVMESGAWPRTPYASGMVGAIAIRQSAWYYILHHQRGYHVDGRCYDISAGDQYIRREIHPGHHLARTTRNIVHDIGTIHLTKHGRFFMTGWRGNSGRDGWHLYEDTITRLARHGWSWPRLIHQQLDPVTIHGHTR